MMEGAASPALEIALEYIFLNKLIKERHTLLAGRLVCRTWRACRTFSAAITSVTLHTPVDVQLAADLFADTPRQRPVWPSVEESQAFPNLKTLKVSEFLTIQLSESGPLRDILAAIKKVRVDLELNLNEGVHRLQARLSIIDVLTGLVSSLTLRWEMVEQLGLRSSIASGSGLTRLRRLRVYDISPLVDALPSLTELAECFSTFAVLSQLTRLDFDEPIFFDGNIDAVKRQLNDLAPATLKEVRVVLRHEVTDPSVEDTCMLHVVLTDGLLVTEHSECVIEINNPQELDWKISNQLSNVAQYIPSSSELEINLRLRLERFAVDLSELAFIKDLSLCVLHEPRTRDWELRDAHIFPALTSKASPMEATRLKFQLRGDGRADLNSLVGSLPTLMPHLQHLTLDIRTVSYQPITSLCQLTTLTHLTMCVHSYDYHVCCLYLELPPLPSSLREVKLSGAYIKLPSLANLEHLTKLSVKQDRLRHDDPFNCNLDALYACHAPLHVLSLEGLPPKPDLPLLVQAFPHLEVMVVALDNYDIRPLSSLSRLRDLTLHVPDSYVLCSSEEPSWMGLDSLTSLSSLNVKKASCCLDILSTLGKLTQLRHLEYGLSSYGQNEDWTSRWRNVIKQLQLSMPHTGISMCGRALSIEGLDFPFPLQPLGHNVL